jgi:hypothetical protein
MNDRSEDARVARPVSEDDLADFGAMGIQGG